MKARRMLPVMMMAALACAGTAYGGETGSAVIDFEDGNAGFIAMDTAPGDASECEAEIADWNGSKALKINAEDGKVPYVGIDLASLAGDRIADVRSVEMTIGTEGADGTFYAVSGTINAYVGEDRTMVSSPWSVFMEKKNPKTAVFELKEDQSFAPGAQNILVITKGNKSDSDVGMFKGEGPAIIYLDDICLLDAEGNAIPVDTTVEFDKPAGFGAADMSNLTGLLGENVLDGASGSSNGSWGQAVALDTELAGGSFDPSVLEPGTIVTVYYAADTAPELILQSWEEGAPETMGWAKIAPSAVNDSNTICQYTYDDIAAVIGTDDFISYLDKLYVGDTGSALNVSKVSVAKPAGEEFDIEGAAGESDGSWGQAVVLATLKDGGTFDPALLAKGCTISVYYSADTAPELVLQSWTDGCPESAGWAKVAASTDNGSVATYTYEDMAAAFGSEDFEAYLDNFIVGDTGSALTVTRVTVQ